MRKPTERRSDWLIDALTELGEWHRSGLLDQIEAKHAWGDSDTLWRACMQPIRMPPGSRPPPGAEPPTRSIASVGAAINALMEAEDVKYSVWVMRAFYLKGPSKAAKELGLAYSTVCDYRRMGEHAIRGYLSR